MPTPTQDELNSLPVKDRLDLINQQRQSRHQTFNSVGILFGVVFTAASLVATALTLRGGQEELRNAREGLHSAQEGQITDRYTKTIEQLGSSKPEVRLGGIYALERLMTDSARDHGTILEVLTSYVRVHAQDPPPAGSDKTRLAVDVQAALAVVGRRDRTHEKGPSTRIDLSNVDFHSKKLSSSDLRGANLAEANLRSANLAEANLSGANLRCANLTRANLTSTNLTSTNLDKAGLPDARLPGADLTNAILRNADLRGADLSDTDLTSADLTNAHLTGATMSSAKLRKDQVADGTGTGLMGSGEVAETCS